MSVLGKVSRNIERLKRQFLPVEMKGSPALVYHSSVQFMSQLKREHGSELRRMIETAEAIGSREIGAMLCMGPAETIRLGQECWGDRYSVSLVSCPNRLSRIGSFHVHLKGSDVFSPTDLYYGIKAEMFSCLGYMKAGVPTVKCAATQKYYGYPRETRNYIRRSLLQTRRDVHKAAELRRNNPVDPEARNLLGRALASLRELEEYFDVYEMVL